MTNKHLHTSFLLLFSLIWILLCSVPALAAEDESEKNPGIGGAAAETAETSAVILCGQTLQKEKDSTTSSDLEVSLQAPKTPDSAEANNSSTAGRQGELIGYFTTTGFCTCSKCCGSQNSGLTASGTVPKALHTIAADTSLYPFGTQLMIDGVIYTVEDEGSGIKKDWLDVYYSTHEEAVAHGTKYHQAVYRVIS